MDDRNKEIIVRDSRSENMIRRLLLVPEIERSRRQRWLLLANGGALLGLSDEHISSMPKNRLKNVGG
jgi:hypothetical protein